MIPLPIDAHCSKIISLLNENPSLVLTAGPGAGKTTRVAPAILKSSILENTNQQIIMLQPRRIAAKSCALRIAEENAWSIGDEIGYQMRFENTVKPNTKIKIMTEGILTRKLVDDPELKGIGLVILDEFHERSLDLDLCLGLLKEIQETFRDDLKILVMSATLDSKLVSSYLGDCPVVDVPGFVYKVKINYLKTNYAATLAQKVYDQIENVFNDFEENIIGNILVFLPGMKDILESQGLIRTLAENMNFDVYVLHGSLNIKEQGRIMLPAVRNKIILSTNIAETSLTIPDVKTVIDAGYQKILRFNSQHGINRLMQERISLASAEQRKGRAGRIAKGQCYRLWTETEEKDFNNFTSSEIKRIELCSAFLFLYSWGISSYTEFSWFEKPNLDQANHANKILISIVAIKGNQKNGYRVTPLGHALLKYPLHPRLACLLYLCQKEKLFSIGRDLGAILSERDFLKTTKWDRAFNSHPYPSEVTNSDVLLRFDVFLKANKNQIDRASWVKIPELKMVNKLIQDFKKYGDDQSLPFKPNMDKLLRILFQVYSDALCKRRADQKDKALMVTGRGVKISDVSIVKDLFFVAFDLREVVYRGKKEASVSILSAVKKEWIIEDLKEQIIEKTQYEYSELKDKISAVKILEIGRIIIEEKPIQEKDWDQDEVSLVMFNYLIKNKERLFKEEFSVKQLLLRIQLMKMNVEGAFENFNEDEIYENSIRFSCMSIRNRKDLDQCNWFQIFKNNFSYDEMKSLDIYLPEIFEAPSGSKIKVKYSLTERPQISVRLHEIFSLVKAPIYGNGKFPCLMDILGPNKRSVQLTDDLENFWKTTYFMVKKDMKQKYKRHFWPDDPINAKPNKSTLQRHNKS